jgi:FAD/FMN-containing dehydrogenase
VIDVTQMKRILVDPDTRTARAETALTWGEFDRETQKHGLATTDGLVSTTGSAGLTLGGGVGWLMRQHGLFRALKGGSDFGVVHYLRAPSLRPLEGQGFLE